MISVLATCLRQSFFAKASTVAEAMVDETQDRGYGKAGRWAQMNTDYSYAKGTRPTRKGAEFYIQLSTINF